VNIVQAHLPQQILELSHHDSSMLPGEYAMYIGNTNSFRSTVEPRLATPS